MAARRYKRILEASKYYSAVDNFIAYITDSTKRGQNVGNGDPRPESKKLYIDPFGVTLATGQVVPTSAALPSWTTHQAAFSTHTDATKPTDEALIINLGGGFRAARVNIVTGKSNTGVVKISKVTGLKYLSYGGKSTSIPFGRKNETETQQAAFDEIKALIVAAVSGASVSLKPEVI